MSLQRKYEDALQAKLLVKKKALLQAYLEVSEGYKNFYGGYDTGRLKANFDFYTVPGTPILGKYNPNYRRPDENLNTDIPGGANESLRVARTLQERTQLLAHDFTKSPIHFRNLLTRSSDPKINYYFEGEGATKAEVLALFKAALAGV